MLPEKSDLRTKRTHILLRDTLIDLIVEKGFDVITVRDIAERAMINRATFYRHFEDKYALVTFIFEEAIEDLLLAVGPPEEDLDILADFELEPGETPGPKMKEAIATTAKFFEYFAQNEKLYRSLLGKRGSQWFSSQMRDFLSRFWLRRIQSSKLPLNKKGSMAGYAMSAEMATACMAQAIVGLITWWLENGMAETPREMALGCLAVVYGYSRALGL